MDRCAWQMFVSGELFTSERLSRRLPLESQLERALSQLDLGTRAVAVHVRRRWDGARVPDCGLRVPSRPLAFGVEGTGGNPNAQPLPPPVWRTCDAPWPRAGLRLRVWGSRGFA